MLDLERLRLIRFRPEVVVDATELGDLLPLAGVDYRVGAETAAETGEPHAQPEEAKPQCVQSFTYPFVLERTTDRGAAPVPPPDRYDHYRETQPYSLTIEVHGGEIYGDESGWLSYRLFERMPGTKGSLWTYRRLVDAEALPRVSANDLTLFNWPGNDYRDRSIIDAPATRVVTALQDAKRVSLGFLHWLQTSAPVEGDRLGAPELRLRPDVMGTTDGFSMHPYIRESRRIRASQDGRRAGGQRRAPAWRARRTVRRLGRDRLVSDRYPSIGAGGRRRQHPHATLSDSAWRPDPRRHRQSPRCGEEHRHDAHHEWVLTGSIRSSGTSARPQGRSPRGHSRGSARSSRSARPRGDRPVPATRFSQRGRRSHG